MRYLFHCLLLTLACFTATAQPLIHAHNDYQKPEPLTNALHCKAFSIEADIYLSGNRLLVAHDKNELATAKTLDAIYLQPIVQLYRQHHGKISAETGYALMLMIDIKEKGDSVLPQLINLLAPYRSVFDRSVNPTSVQIVISGDRGAISKWTSYPPYIFFDGRPYEAYDSATLQRVALISDSYLNYVSQQDSSNRLQQVVKKVHDMEKLLRLWASPDNPASWGRQQELGIDIINTDKVTECRDYFSKKAH